jgi:hypothetical protein
MLVRVLMSTKGFWGICVAVFVWQVRGGQDFGWFYRLMCNCVDFSSFLRYVSRDAGKECRL